MHFKIAIPRLVRNLNKRFVYFTKYGFCRLTFSGIGLSNLVSSETFKLAETLWFVCTSLDANESKQQEIRKTAFKDMLLSCSL